MKSYNFITNWTEDDLYDLPQESDQYEYKSSRIAENKNYKSILAEKLQVAASAFWNTGGGVFIVGVDEETGEPDGGIPKQIGRQSLRDWADQILYAIQPIGQYQIHVIESRSQNAQIDADNVVLVIGFDESGALPHMAPDNKYYIRAGAHSVSANHYILESLYSRRGLREPLLRTQLRIHKDKKSVVELAIICVNDTPALDVHIDFDPIPGTYERQLLPIIVPVIDKLNSFTMEIFTLGSIEAWFKYEAVNLLLSYSDAANRSYETTQTIIPKQNISGVEFEHSRSDDPRKSLQHIYKELQQMRFMTQNYLRHKLSSEDDND